MPIPLFHENNTFHIYKHSGQLKIINFTCNKVTLYYKLYSILRKKHNYHLQTSTVRDITGRVLMNGNFMDLFTSLISELQINHKYVVSVNNSDGDEVLHWCNDEEEVIAKLNAINDTFIKNNDNRQYESVLVTSYQNNERLVDTLGALIDFFYERSNAVHKTEETKKMKVQNNMCVMLDFAKVLEEMKPKILFGDDKEKSEAKAILAYVATKLAEQ